MSAAALALGTYIGHGPVDGCDTSYTLKLNEKKLFWMDYRSQPPVATAQAEQFHVDGSFECAGSKVKCTIGGLPGQGRQGQVWEFEVPADAKSLTRDGVVLKGQSDTNEQGNADENVCAGCGKPCTGEFMKVGTELYHKECFVCDGCKQPLSGKFKKTPDGQKLCPTCQPKEVCTKCGFPITGKKTKVGDNLYHPECFTCDDCDWPLAGGFMKKGDKTLCKDCCDGKPAKPNPPPKPDFSQGAAAPAPAAPKVIAAPVKEKKPLLAKLGPYICAEYERKPEKGLPEKCMYTITLLEDNQLWLDFESQSKIDSQKWHTEGCYDETSATNICYTVEARPYGGGPKVGTVISLTMNLQANTITFDDQTCKLNGGITNVEMENISVDAPKAGPPPAAAKPAAAAPAAPAAAAPASGEVLTLAQLQDESVWKPKGIPAESRETYLSDAEFQTCFGCDKKTFEGQPKWKRETAKKKHKLY